MPTTTFENCACCTDPTVVVECSTERVPPTLYLTITFPTGETISWDVLELVYDTENGWWQGEGTYSNTLCDPDGPHDMKARLKCLNGFWNLSMCMTNGCSLDGLVCDLIEPSGLTQDSEQPFLITFGMDSCDTCYSMGAAFSGEITE